MLSQQKNGATDDLARMTAHGFADVHAKMDKSFAAVREDIHILRTDTEAGFREVTETLKALREDIQELRKDVLDINNIRKRLEQIERRVGIST